MTEGISKYVLGPMLVAASSCLVAACATSAGPQVATRTTASEPVGASNDGSALLVRRGHALFVKRGTSENQLPAEIAQVSDTQLGVTADGSKIGVFDDSSSPLTFTVYDASTGQVVATLTHEAPAGGASSAGFGATPGSVQWTFTRQACELRDIMTGKPKCGSCDNTAFVAFMKGQGRETIPAQLPTATPCVL
jgi:uncharacterized cupin superfamily protein